MRRRGPSREFSELRSCSGKKTVESCKVKGDVDKVVFIDLEDEDVIDVDYPESLQPQSRGSSTLRKDGKSKFCSFIYIDDDNDDDNYVTPVISVEEVGDLDSDATSSKSSFPASNYRQNSVASDGDECQVVQENGSALKRSSCKQTRAGKAPGRNRYGLGFESESDSSDSDYSDCELIEGSYGKLHEHWEKASQKRKHLFIMVNLVQLIELVDLDLIVIPMLMLK
ncbi:dentin sialophosphoprotein [Prunus yedoensis var. nudiflora]|uniref:Dentin sialophosphoprotein n=1 Tax=Prunus yedoensis var. nudiflora TaxID=2094558 RepID=A0A314ZEZ8_PRUYE|nr:dentin sialophosphoprotein [Prunus yedoensis var. nudiflora]